MSNHLSGTESSQASGGPDLGGLCLAFSCPAAFVFRVHGVCPRIMTNTRSCCNKVDFPVTIEYVEMSPMEKATLGFRAMEGVQLSAELPTSKQ